MSKFWQGRLNTSWKETVSSTVTGLSDGAARLRQNLQVPADGRPGETAGTLPESQAGKPQQYLRLPVESAKKLRWYDRPDLNNLIQQNLRDKNDLLGVNAALRQVLLSRGVSEDDLETELEEKLLDIDRMRTYDEGVNAVLVASAADEIASLRAQIYHQADEIEQLKDRLRSAENSGSSALSSGQGDHQTKAVSHQSQPHTSGTPPRYPSPSPLHVAPHAAASAPAPQPSLQGSAQQPSQQGSGQQPRSSSTEQPPSTRAVPNTSAGSQPRAASKTGSTADTVQLVLDVSESSSSVHATLSPVGEAAIEDVIQSDVKAAAGAAAESHGHESAAASSHQAHSQQSAESASDAPTGQHSLGSGFGSPSLTELQGLLMEERRKTAELIGKLQRLEEERQAHVSQLEAQDVTLEDMDRQTRELHSQANTALQNLKEVSDVSERQVAHLRAQAATSSGQHLESLRKAQDICTQAEARADAADRKAQKAEGDLRRATADLRAREREREAAESRAAAAQAESEKGANSGSALAAAKRAADDREAELRRSLRDAESKHKQQVAQLDASVHDLQRTLAKSQQEVSSLEQRLGKAEQAESEALRELREAESAAVDQESLLLRASALEDKLKEHRAEQGQLENYKQLTAVIDSMAAAITTNHNKPSIFQACLEQVGANCHEATEANGDLSSHVKQSLKTPGNTTVQLTKELEAAKARVEDEVIATVQIATKLEGRLRQAKQDADLAQQQAQQAQQRANQAEQIVEANAKEAANGPTTLLHTPPPRVPLHLTKPEEMLVMQAEQSVEAEAGKRLASIGTDRTRWPAAARDEVMRLKKKQQALSSMLEALQHSLNEECEGRRVEVQARAEAQERCSAADECLSKLEWESNQASVSLQRKVTLLQQQLDDMRHAAMDAEQERDRLALAQRRLPSRSSFGSLGPNTPKRGGGSLGGAGPLEDDSATPLANGSHREHMDGVDIVYLKNVLLKFVDAHAHGRTQECSTLLPAIAALLRATPLEYRILKDTLQRSEKTGNWWARAVS